MDSINLVTTSGNVLSDARLSIANIEAAGPRRTSSSELRIPNLPVTQKFALRSSRMPPVSARPSTVLTLASLFTAHHALRPSF